MYINICTIPILKLIVRAVHFNKIDMTNSVLFRFVSCLQIIIKMDLLLRENYFIGSSKGLRKDDRMCLFSINFRKLRSLYSFHFLII